MTARKVLFFHDGEKNTQKYDSNLLNDLFYFL